MKHHISIGDKFGRLTVVDVAKNKKNKTVYICKCECGKVKTYEPSNLALGKTKSCGCLQKETVHNLFKKENTYKLCGEYVIGVTSSGDTFLFDSEDFEIVKKYCWCKGRNGYIYNGARKTLHRLLMNPPEGMIVDHINRVKTDNRKSNLRICNYSQNGRNKEHPPKGINRRVSGDKVYYTVFLRGKYYGIFKDYERAKIKRDEVWESIKDEYDPN